MESAPSPISPRRSLNSSSNNIVTKPTWLLSILADVEERMKMLALNTSQDQDNGGDTFAERAEAYYKRRPQLLSLLQDLYNAYLTLSDRYIQTIAKTHHHPAHSSDQISTIYNNEYYYYDQQEDGETSQIDSDIESSLSYQLPPSVVLPNNNTREKDDTMLSNFDAIVTEIVMKNVEYDLLLHEANATERRHNESSRKIELQKSLLEVLESERLILLHENAKLGYKVGALMEENKALVSESLFMRRKAGELGRCLLKMREDHRVCMLSRKIEDLQGQIYGLEKRNKEYYEQLVKRDQQEDEESSMDKKRNGNQVDLVVCFQMGKINQRLKRSGGISNDGNGKSINGSGKKGSSWWGRVKNLYLFLCGRNSSST